MCFSTFRQSKSSAHIGLMVVIAMLCTSCTLPNFLSFSSESHSGKNVSSTTKSPIPAAETEAKESADVSALDLSLPDQPLNLHTTHLILPPNDNSDFITSAYHSGVRKMELDGKNVEFLGPTNDQHMFMVNVDHSLNFYDSNTFEKTESFDARGCTEVTFDSVVFCASPSEQEIIVFDTHFQAEQYRIPIPFHADNIRHLGKLEYLDILQIESKDHNDLIVAVSEFQTITWEQQVASSASCGLTAQNAIVVCSERADDEYVVNTFSAHAGTPVSDARTRGQILGATLGWVEKTDKEIKYFTTDGTEAATKKHSGTIIDQIFPWNTMIHTGGISPSPEAELGYLIETPTMLYNSGHAIALQQIGTADSPRLFAKPGQSNPVFTLYEGERIRSMDGNGQLVVVENDASLFLKDTENQSELVTVPNTATTQFSVNRGWFAVKQTDTKQQKVTVFLPEVIQQSAPAVPQPVLPQPFVQEPAPPIEPAQPVAPVQG